MFNFDQVHFYLFNTNFLSRLKDTQNQFFIPKLDLITGKHFSGLQNIDATCFCFPKLFVTKKGHEIMQLFCMRIFVVCFKTKCKIEKLVQKKGNYEIYKLYLKLLSCKYRITLYL